MKFSGLTGIVRLSIFLEKYPKNNQYDPCHDEKILKNTKFNKKEYT